MPRVSLGGRQLIRTRFWYLVDIDRGNLADGAGEDRDGHIIVAITGRSRRMPLDLVENTLVDAGLHPDRFEAVTPAMVGGRHWGR